MLGSSLGTETRPESSILAPTRSGEIFLLGSQNGVKGEGVEGWWVGGWEGLFLRFLASPESQQVAAVLWP